MGKISDTPVIGIGRPEKAIQRVVRKHTNVAVGEVLNMQGLTPSPQCVPSQSGDVGDRIDNGVAPDCGEAGAVEVAFRLIGPSVRPQGIADFGIIRDSPVRNTVDVDEGDEVLTIV